MQIISKRKDYYDYYQGIFGIDKTKVFNRTGFIKVSNQWSHHKDDFMTGKRVPIEMKLEKGYWQKDTYPDNSFTIHTFAINHKLYFIMQNSEGFHRITKTFLNHINKRGNVIDNMRDFIKGIEIPTNVNKELRIPIAYSSDYGSSWETEHPLMNTFGFHKVMDARDLYIEVETFMGYLKDHPEIPNNQTDIGKLESAGFDKKISFRHRK
jgi:hypothetical protein